jgi:hypothetical protein
MALSAVRKCKDDGIGIVLVSNDLRVNERPQIRGITWFAVY